MKNIHKFIFGLSFFMLILCSFFLCSRTTTVYAAELGAEQSTSETTTANNVTTIIYNYITSIDVSSIPSEIKEKEGKDCVITLKYQSDYRPSGIYTDDYDKDGVIETYELKTETLTYYIDSSSSNGKGYVYFVGYDASGNVKANVAGVEEGSCKLIFHGIYHERTDTSSVRVTYDISVKAYESIGSIITGILTSNTVLILILSVAFTVVGKFAIKIFRFGVNYKSNFASVEDNEKFKTDIRKELAANKEQTRDDVLKLCFREIARETRPVRDLQEQLSKFEKDKSVLDVRLDNFDDKFEEIKRVSQNINTLSTKVTRLEYGEGTSGERRTGK